MQDIFLLLDTVKLRRFSQDRYRSPSFSITTFQNFPGISDLLSQVPKYKSHLISLFDGLLLVFINKLQRTPLLSLHAAVWVVWVGSRVLIPFLFLVKMFRVVKELTTESQSPLPLPKKSATRSSELRGGCYQWLAGELW
jgi:hypothetical protein